MTILFFARRFYPDVGGVEKHILEISRRLILKGNKVVIVREDSDASITGEPTNYQSVGQSDIHYINARKPVKSIQTEILRSKKINVLSLNFGGDDFFKKFRIWEKIYQIRPLIEMSDVIHAHDVFFWYLPFRFLNPTKKIFTTFHGYETKFPPAMGAKIVRRISARLSRGNINVGRYITKWYGTRADFVTYGGVEIYKNKHHIVNRGKKIRRIVFLGRIEEDNGAKIYLAALKALKKRGISFKFTAVGDGKMRKKVETLGTVAGFRANPFKYLASADLVFASSYLSILEALALKKKVFAVFQNELKEDYLKMSPFAKFISISSDSQSLAKAILTPRKREGYDWARSQTWDKVTNLYLKLWQK